MMFSANYTMKVSIRSKMFLSSLNQNLTYVLHARASASELSCRSLNQNLLPASDIHSLSGWRGGEAVAGEGVPGGAEGGGFRVVRS